MLGECEANPVLETIITLSNLLMCINSAANFLMYMVSHSGVPVLITKYRVTQPPIDLDL